LFKEKHGLARGTLSRVCQADRARLEGILSLPLLLSLSRYLSLSLSLSFSFLLSLSLSLALSLSLSFSLFISLSDTLALPPSFWSQQFGAPGRFSAPKMMDLHRRPSIAT